MIVHDEDPLLGHFPSKGRELSDGRTTILAEASAPEKPGRAAFDTPRGRGYRADAFHRHG
jgi:hypothetical protein